VRNSAPDCVAVQSTTSTTFAFGTNVGRRLLIISPSYRAEMTLRYNNKPPRNMWIRDLDMISSSLPDLLVQVLTGPTVIYGDEGWKGIVKKVSFIDYTLDYAHTNRWLGVDER
jgi:hypothetical protein